MENVTQKISYDHKIISVFGRDRLIFYWDKIKNQEFPAKFDDAIAHLPIDISKNWVRAIHELPLPGVSIDALLISGYI